MAVVQTAVASTAASARDTGVVVASVAAAAIAWLIFMLPHSVVTVSVATAYFTRMSQHAASNDMAKFKIDMTTGLKVIALVSMISTAMLDSAVLSDCPGFRGGVPRDRCAWKCGRGIHDRPGSV